MVTTTSDITVENRNERWSTFSNEYAEDHHRGDFDPVNRHLMKLLGKVIQPQMEILDFGCNVGELVNLIQNQYHVAIEACDINPHAVKIASERYPDIHFYVESNPKNIQKRYDIVLLIEVLEHIEDRVTFLKDIKELVLKPGGYLIVVVPNHWALLSRFAAFITGKKFAFDPTHTIEFTPSTFRKLVSDVGMRVQKMETNPLAIPGLQKISPNLKEKIPGWIFGRHIYAVLRS